MITSISTAMDDVSQIQSKLGASINRLNDTANNLTSMQDNTEVAIGNIMDTDYATGSVQYDQTASADAGLASPC
ncbi:lateral flagellin FliC-like protein [Escherichia coli]|uniref:Lateral flagellin FliC-like protein n=1 Tax=Escherichia coli TaxID=562 RepID=A0A447XAE9_ECOLX|nr:lateral flagellin FliC-like protein [Escherichia coli]